MRFMTHEATADNPYTRGIAEFVSSLRYEAIPQEVRSRIKLLMLDSFGCALYGADLEWCRILQEKLSALDATRACAIWGTERKPSAPHAALVNGTAVQGFELDAGKTVRALGIAGTQAAGLGETWQTMGVALKFYACVGSNHTTLDAIRDMQRERPFGAADVAGVAVHGCVIRFWGSRSSRTPPKSRASCSEQRESRVTPFS
jgi:2-methylcitrate dehydratase PrpD